MKEFTKLLKTTGIPCNRNIQGLSPQVGGSDDCQCTNCDGFGACECNCDCADE
jgi:hypothetical protein